ncbi:MAG: metal-dependent hydrolase [Haloferacaceae archaeon]
MIAEPQSGSTVYQLGHYGVALLLYAPVVGPLLDAGGPRAALAGGALVAVAAILPDCDEFLPIPHRGPTHTVWFVAAVGLLAAGGVAALSVREAAWGPVAGLLAAGAVASHVAVDALTPMGIRPFAPASDWHVTLDLVPSKHRTANAGLFLLGGAAVAVAVAF